MFAGFSLACDAFAISNIAEKILGETIIINPIIGYYSFDLGLTMFDSGMTVVIQGNQTQNIVEEKPVFNKDTNYWKKNKLKKIIDSLL